MAAFLDPGAASVDPAEAARLAAMARAAASAGTGDGTNFIDPGATTLPTSPVASGGNDFIDPGAAPTAAPAPPTGAPGAMIDPGAWNPITATNAMNRAATAARSGGNDFISPGASSNPIAATNALNRAAAAAGRPGSLGSGANNATTVPTSQPAAAPTLQQAATGGTIGATPANNAAVSAPSTVRGITPTPPATPGTGVAGGPSTNAAVNNAIKNATANPAPTGTNQTAVETPPGAKPPPGTNQTAVETPPGVANQNPNPVGAAPAPTAGGDLGTLTTGITNQFNAIQASLNAPGTSPDATAVFMRQSQSILAMLDQQEAQMRAENQKAGTTVDPATQFAIDKLKENLQEQLKTTREHLNSRGLYDSGIELSLENNLQKGSASDQAQILSTRLSKLQDQLQAGLTQFRTQRYSTASQFGLAGANAQQQTDQQGRDLAQRREQEALSGMLSLRGQMSTAQEQQAQRAQLAQQFSSDQSFRGAQATQLQNANAANQRVAQQAAAQLDAARLAEQKRQYDETFGMEKAKYNETAAATLAQNTIQNQNAAMARAARAAGGAGRAIPTQINNAFGRSTKTPATSAEATNAAINAVGGATDRSSALSSLTNNAGRLQSAGVNLQTVSDAIDAKFPPSVADSTDASIGGRRRTAGGPVE